MNVKLQWFAWGVLASAVVIGGAWWISSHKATSSDKGIVSTSTVITENVAGATKTDTKVPIVKTEVTPIGTAEAPVYSADEVGVTKTTVAAGETVSVMDQTAGMSIAVKDVTLAKPTWIAIKDTKGWVLGARRFDASVDNVTVPLLRTTVAGDTYQAVMYVDDGDNAFNMHKDNLVTDSANAPVASTFKAL